MRNRIHAYLTAENLRCPELNLYSKAGQAWLATVDLPAVVHGQVTLVLANHALLTSQIQILDRHVKTTVRRNQAARRPDHPRDRAVRSAAWDTLSPGHAPSRGC